MSETTVTVRGVDSKAWKGFQTGIVSLHGNLYGNIGQEVTNALKLWLERNRGMESAVGIPADRLSISYDDIGGLKEEIKMIRETVEMPLRHPELFRWLNLIPPKGVLIHGPPGTGKNILARAAAAEAKAWLYVINMQQMISESSEERLRAVSQRAKESAPSVILIPDLAVTAIGRQKTAGDPTDQILSWLLSEMGALEDFGRVVVIGIVSSPEELEPSLRQRFQREIEVSLPDRQGRLEILGIQARRMPLADDVDLGRLADMTDEYPGVLLWRMCQEAATWALRRSLEHEKITDEEIPQERLEQIKVGMKDFLHALDSVKP
jgi:transitional endoplasmic reticulum ATPase